MTTHSKKPLSPTPSGYPEGYHPNTLANLAKGRAKLAEMRKNGILTNPKGYSLKSALIDTLAKPLTPPKKDALARDLFIHSTIEGAILREPTPFKEVWDRVDGRLQDNIPPVSIDNRQVNIYVLDNETRELLAKVAERTGNQRVLGEGKG